jgi:ABC-2 type transport system permease protein
MLCQQTFDTHDTIQQLIKSEVNFASGGSMSQFFGIFCHEFKMAIRRPGMWIANAVLYIFYTVTIFSPTEVGTSLPQSATEMWQHAGFTLLYANMFMVILGGILAADRMQRDFQLGVRELQLSSPLNNAAYVLAKYFGVLFAVISPMLLFVMAYAGLGVAQGVPASYLGIMLAVFFAMGLPAFAFVTAFSLACPLFMPLRVYQVLFVGYWFWGNYMSPSVFPTISDTLLVPSGKYVFYGLIGGFPENMRTFTPPVITSTQAVLNLVILFSVIVVVLVVTTLILRRQTRQA